MAAPAKGAVVPWDAALRKLAEAEVAREKGTGGSGISIRGGVYTYGGAELGSSLRVVICHWVYFNSWYDRPFNEEQNTPPGCFALALENPDQMGPPENAPNRQGDEEGLCRNCWANAFRSDERGRGKACRNSRRLACLAEDDLEGEIALLSLPPTSLKRWAGYSRKLAAAHAAYFGVITELGFTDDTYPSPTFEADRGLTEDELRIVVGRREEAEAMIMLPPSIEGYEPPPERKRGPAPSPKGGGKPAAETQRGGRSRFSR